MENIPVELKKEEALERMKAMNIFGQAWEKFRRGNHVMVSEPPFGGLYYLSDAQKAIAKRLWEEHGALVYMVVRSCCQDMVMDSYLYVSDHKEEWEADRDDIHEGYAFTWTENVTYPELSEFGIIEFCRRGGGIIRVA